MYSDKESIKRQVRKMERRVARTIAEHAHRATPLSDEGVFEIESDLEWFLTWRLKLDDLPFGMWCDGVQDLLITPVGGLAYEIVAKAWVGPESDTSVQRLCDLEGTVRLDLEYDKLSSYSFHIAYEGQVYHIEGAI